MARFLRKPSTKQPKRVIRIYTEGKKTEPDYFNSIRTELRLREIDIKVCGLADHTINLVEHVIDRKSQEKDIDTEWWVVFDKDDHTDFNRAIERAESEGICVAYSNECFELWFILHYILLDSSIGRKNYNKKLSGLVNQNYDKTCSNMYELIKDKEQQAIRHAKILEKKHDKEGNHSQVKRDPSTTVYKLVERLRMLKEISD